MFNEIVTENTVKVIEEKKYMGERKPVAEVNLFGEVLLGRLLVYSTPIGMLLRGEMKLNESANKKQPCILKLCFEDGENTTLCKKINEKLPLMYVKNGRAWLRFVTAKLSLRDIMGRNVSVYRLNSELSDSIGSTQKLAEGRIMLCGLREIVEKKPISLKI